MSGKVEIILDNNAGFYSPSQTITGRVDYCATVEENITAIRLKFDGRAETKWTESEKYYDDFYKEDRTRDVDYGAIENYFVSEFVLVHGGENFRIPVGMHSYPFTQVLPQHLPSSYDGIYGKVCYSIEVLIEYPWKFAERTTTFLNLVSPIDLNFLPDLREPLALSVDKTPCSCWCQNSGLITFTISLPAKGFVPGQEINIGANVMNLSNVSAECIKFKIVSSYEYIANRPSHSTRYEEITVADCTEGGIGAHGEKSWTSRLTIPTNQTYPNLVPCNIINVKHYLKGKLVLPCPHTNLDVDGVIVIGTVPLFGINLSFPGDPPSQHPNDPTAPPLEGSPPYGATGWALSGEIAKKDESAPPSYDQAQQLINGSDKSQ